MEQTERGAIGVREGLWRAYCWQQVRTITRHEEKARALKEQGVEAMRGDFSNPELLGPGT